MSESDALWKAAWEEAESLGHVEGLDALHTTVGIITKALLNTRAATLRDAADIAFRMKQQAVSISLDKRASQYDRAMTEGGIRR